MCHYMFLNDVDAQRWALMGTVVKLAQSVRYFYSDSYYLSVLIMLIIDWTS